MTLIKITLLIEGKSFFLIGNVVKVYTRMGYHRLSSRPTLFIIYINDDTTIANSNIGIENMQIEKSLCSKSLTDWLLVDRLFLNQKKRKTYYYLL